MMAETMQRFASHEPQSCFVLLVWRWYMCPADADEAASFHTTAGPAGGMTSHAGLSHGLFLTKRYLYRAGLLQVMKICSHIH